MGKLAATYHNSAANKTHTFSSISVSLTSHWVICTYSFSVFQKKFHGTQRITKYFKAKIKETVAVEGNMYKWICRVTMKMEPGQYIKMICWSGKVDKRLVKWELGWWKMEDTWTDCGVETGETG